MVFFKDCKQAIIDSEGTVTGIRVADPDPAQYA